MVPLALAVIERVFSFVQYHGLRFFSYAFADVMLPVPARVSQAPVRSGHAHLLLFPPLAAPFLSLQQALVPPHLCFQLSCVRHAVDFAIAVSDLPRVPVNANSAPVPVQHRRAYLIADNRFPTFARLADYRLDRLAVRVWIAATSANRQPAHLRDGQPAILDAHVLRNGK